MTGARSAASVAAMRVRSPGGAESAAARAAERHRLVHQLLHLQRLGARRAVAT